MFSAIYHTILYQPLFNLLVFFYNFIPGNDVGFAIIALTLLIKVILYPVSAKSIRNQKALQQLQPKMEEIKKKYKDDREKMAQETMNLYRQEKVNPFSSCFPILIQLPIFIAVYNVFRVGLSAQDFPLLYPFISNPGMIDTVSLGLIDLSAARSIPGLVLALLAGIAQYVQVKMLSVKQPPKNKEGQVDPGAKDESMMAAMNKQMLYFMPVFTVIIGYTLPAGLVLYWFITTLALVLQQRYSFKKNGSDTQHEIAS